MRPVPPHAVVDESAVAQIEQQLEDAESSLQELLDAGYHDLDGAQPALAEYLASEVSGRGSELAQSLGYFLVVTVFLSFREAFAGRLASVQSEDMRVAIETLSADEELRAQSPNEVLDSDDVVAMGQPVVLRFVQHHVQEAVNQSDDDADLEDIDRIYRAVLVEVIALSHAIEPAGGTGPGREDLA